MRYLLSASTLAEPELRLGALRMGGRENPSRADQLRERRI